MCARYIPRLNGVVYSVYNVPGAENLDPTNPADADHIDSLTLNEETALLGYQNTLAAQMEVLPTPQALRACNATAHPSVQFTNGKAFKRALLHTALGQPYWPVGCGVTNNGPMAYLAPKDFSILESRVDQHAGTDNPYTTDELALNAYLLREERLRSAMHKLRYFPKLVATIASWLGTHPPANLHSIFTMVTGINLLVARQVDMNRQFAANPHRIQGWFFTHNQLVMHLDPRLKFNGDEMGIDSNSGRLRIFSRDQNPIAPAQPNVSHITMFCVCSAAGAVVPPYVILHNLLNLPQELNNFGDKVWFASTKSGWQTEHSFYAWCLHFTHWAASYRMTLPKELQCETIYIFLDGHGSRCCPEALLHLALHKIELVIFPSHTTHVLQPFDVGLASPLRAAFHRFRRTARSNLLLTRMNIRTPTARNRLIVVDSMVRAWYSVASLLNIRSAFLQAGIHPWSLAQVLQSPFVIAGEYREPNRYPITINDLHLNDAEVRRLLPLKIASRGPFPLPVFGTIFADEHPYASDANVVYWVRVNPVTRAVRALPAADVVLFTIPVTNYPRQILIDPQDNTRYVWVILAE